MSNRIQYNVCAAAIAASFLFQSPGLQLSSHAPLSAGVPKSGSVAISEVQIPGGEFAMGDHFNFVDPSHPSDEIPLHTVKVNSLFVGKTETTNQQFLAFLNSALSQGQVEVKNNVVYAVGRSDAYYYTHQYAPWYSIGYDGGVFSIADFRANHPAVGVMWSGAAAYCNWLSSNNGLEPCYDLTTGVCDFTNSGYRLPTEAEWEYAGRGGETNPYFIYPTGNAVNVTKANLPDSGDPYEAGSYPHTTPVGFYDGTLKHKSDYSWPGSAESYQTSDGANGYGLYDMQGNVWEFVNDWYGQNYYSVSDYDNPTGPSSGTTMPDGKAYRGMRGGNWYNGLTTTGVNDGHSRVANRNPSYYRGPQDPDHPWYHIGFRVARNSTENTIEPSSNTVGLIKNDTSKVFKGYTLFAPKQNTMTYLINNEGRIVHQWTASKYPPGQSVYLLENGHLLRTCMTKGQLSSGGGEGGRVEEYDWNDSLVWSLDFSTSTYMQHHDIRRLPNGNIIMLVIEKKTYAEAIAAGFNPNKFQPEIAQKGMMLPDYVVEISPTKPAGGTVVWEWHTWDHLIQDYDATKLNYGVVKSHPELIDAAGDQKNLPAFWNHMNSIDFNADFDQIALSVRGNSEVWIIDHSTTTAEAKGHTGGKSGKGGDLLYRWGNPMTYRSGTVSDQRYFQQHDVEWVRTGCPGAGNLTCFNNGLGRSGGNSSSVDEFTPAVDASGNYAIVSGSAFAPANFTWTYKGTTTDPLYSENISGAHRLPNGNTILCSGTLGLFLEVTSAGEIVWKYICPVDQNGRMMQGATPPADPARAGETMNSVFRVYKYPVDYAAFVGRDLTPGDFVEKYATTSAVSVSGTATYGVGSVPVSGATVTLTSQSGAATTAVTSSTGSYSFAAVSSGVYTLSVTKAGGHPTIYTNAADALKAALFPTDSSAISSTIGRTAADVNSDGAVNAADALQIMLRYVGSLVSFTRGDWIFVPAMTTVSIGTSNITNNITAIAAGDVNVDAAPTGTFFAKPGGSTQYVVPVSGASFQRKGSEEFEVPIRVTSATIIGSLSLAFQYPVECATFLGVRGPDGVLSAANGGAVAVAWYSPLNALNLKENDVVVALRFKPTSDASNFSLTLDPKSQITDAGGSILAGINLALPAFEASVPSEFSLGQNYPNPFNPITAISYQLTANSFVTLRVFDILGREVATLVNATLSAGNRTAQWDASSQPSGVYMYRLEVNGASQTRKMVLAK